MWITTQVLKEFINEHGFVVAVLYLWRSSSLLTCIMEVNIGAKFTGWVQFPSCVNITCLDQIMYVFFAILVNGSILLLREYVHVAGAHKVNMCDVFILRRNRCVYKDYIVFSTERNFTYLNVSLFGNWIFLKKKSLKIATYENAPFYMNIENSCQNVCRMYTQHIIKYVLPYGFYMKFS
jgi:hypothetical protein